MLEEALALARRGYRIFPVWWPIVTAEGIVSCACPEPECRHGGRREREIAKHPIVYAGQNESTCDEAQVRAWWEEYPLANIGLDLAASGLMALDIDDRNGRDAALAKLQAAITATGELPDTVQVVSGSGWHLYYRRPPGVELRGEFMGITVRGRNYVIAPPSLHRSANRYTWETGNSPDDIEVAELPPAWAAALSRPLADLSDVGVPDDEPGWLRDISQENRVSRMREYLASQRGERMGQDRASLAFIVAASAIRGHAVRDVDAALAAMLEYGSRCEPPYSEEAIRERVWNAYEQAHTPEWGAALQRSVLVDAVMTAAHQAAPPEPPDELAARRARAEPEDFADNVEAAAVRIPGDPGEEPLSWAITYVLQRHWRDNTPTIRRWRGSWYQWEIARGCYRDVDDEVVFATIQKEGIQKPKHVEGVKKSMGTVPGVMISLSELGSWVDGRTHAFDRLDTAVTRTTLVDLSTGDRVPASPGFFATATLGADFNPQAPEPVRWLAFLDQLWHDEPDAIAMLQEWFGYMLTPDTRQHKIMLMVGPPRSGKGTIARVLTGLLGGEESVANPTLDQLGERFGPAPLIGKMAAIIGDAKIDGKSAVAQVTARLLSISGGDSQTIDRKNLKAWTGYLSTRFTVLCNSLPRFVDEGGALANRMVILQTTESFLGREDHGLDAVLLAELPGILNWAIEGWRRLRVRGYFLEPASSAEAKQELADLAAPVSAWVRECTARCNLNESVACDLAYTSYKNWARQHGLPEPTSMMFARDLKAATNCSRRQIARGGRRVGVYSGVRLTQEDTPRPGTVPTMPS